MFMAFVATLNSSPTHLLAYTDPGSGALLWQMLLSAGFLLGFYFTKARKWLRSKVTRPEKSEKDDLQR